MRREQQIVIGRLVNEGEPGADATVTVFERDGNEMISRADCTTLPSTKAGYAVGCIMVKTDTGVVYVNTGTTSSCTFSAIGTTIGAGAVQLSNLDAPTAAKVYNKTINNVTDGASMSASAANILAGVITATPTTARNVQIDTAAHIIAAVSGMAAGNYIEFTVVNLATDGSIMTLTTNTGLTLVGDMTVGAAASEASSSFYAIMTGAGAVSIVRR